MQRWHSSFAPFVRHASHGKRRRTAGSAGPVEPKDYGALSPCDGTQAGRGALAFGSDQQRLHRTVSAHTGVTASQSASGGILRAFLPLLLHLLKLGAYKLRVLWQLAACGTPALGANLFHCPHCQHRHWAPRSCGNRHCPCCLWLGKQTQSLLPITYYHCVFTLPADLNSLMLANQRRLYPLLFDCAAQSLLEFGRNRLHGDLGITAVLHTWDKSSTSIPIFTALSPAEH